ncbi:MAG TPA: hypothetical protein VEU94_15805, partial [Terriglobales bacterium]|nr:hypothetical protein [Terriglobales bacterium]
MKPHHNIIFWIHGLEQLRPGSGCEFEISSLYLKRRHPERPSGREGSGVKQMRTYPAAVPMQPDPSGLKSLRMTLL